jgi:hypothetical protein
MAHSSEDGLLAVTGKWRRYFLWGCLALVVWTAGISFEGLVDTAPPIARTLHLPAPGQSPHFWKIHFWNYEVLPPWNHGHPRPLRTCGLCVKVIRDARLSSKRKRAEASPLR